MLDGRAQCRFCGGIARLDLLGRWMISCVIALVLPTVLLYGEVFYSGHLFLVSMSVIFGAWGILSLVCYPLLTMEESPDRFPINRRHSALILVVLVITAMILDGFIASKFEPDDALEKDRSPSALHFDRYVASPSYIAAAAAHITSGVIP